MDNLWQMVSAQFYKAMGWDPEWEKKAESRLQAWMTAMSNGEARPAETSAEWNTGFGPTVDGWLKWAAELITVTIPNYLSRTVPALITTLGDGATQSVVDALRARQPDPALTNIPVGIQAAIHTAAADATDRAYTGFSRMLYAFYKDESQKVAQPQHTARQVYQAVFDQTIIGLINEKYGAGLDPKIAKDLAAQLRNNPEVSRYAASVAAAYSGINPTGTTNMGITTVWQPSGGDNIRYGAGVWQAMHENYGITARKSVSLNIDTRGIESPTAALAVVGQVVDGARDKAQAISLATALGVSRPDQIAALTQMIAEGRASPDNHADKFTPAEYTALMDLLGKGGATAQGIKGILSQTLTLIADIDLSARGITFDPKAGSNITMPMVNWAPDDQRPNIPYPTR